MIEFSLDSRSGVSPYLQVVQQVRHALRLGMLREGVWMRPDNLPRDDAAEPGTLRLLSHPDDPAALTRSLWDLPQWADTGAALLDATSNGATFADRFTAAEVTTAAATGDPVLAEAAAAAASAGDPGRSRSI